MLWDPYLESEADFPSALQSGFWVNNANNYYFDKIVVLTDGTCFSACTMFLSKLMYYNKAYVVAVGGVKGNAPGDTSGGGASVLEWPDFVSAQGALSSCLSPSEVPVAQLPTSAHARFAWTEIYFGRDSSTPREVLKMEANAYLSTWDLLDADRDALYSDVLGGGYFAAMSSGLPSGNSPIVPCCAPITTGVGCGGSDGDGGALLQQNQCCLH